MKLLSFAQICLKLLDHTKMLLIYSNVFDFIQNLNILCWPKFDEDCWNYHMIPVHLRAVFILPSGAK